MSNSIINAVKRLERAGSEHSRATKKLFEAATEVAELIEEIAPVGVPLPRGYKVIKEKSNIGVARFLVRGDDDSYKIEYIDGIGDYLHNDFHCWIPGQKRETVLEFARDVADGLLDEIADFLEKRTQESEIATTILQSAFLL